MPELGISVRRPALIVGGGNVQQGGVVQHMAVNGGADLGLQGQFGGVAGGHGPAAAEHVLGGRLGHVIGVGVAGLGEGQLAAAIDHAAEGPQHQGRGAVLGPQAVDVRVEVGCVGLAVGEAAMDGRQDAVRPG